MAGVLESYRAGLPQIVKPEPAKHDALDMV